MKVLLTKRLFRSLWRSKIRLVAVVLIIMVGVMSGIAFGHYAHMTTNMYSEIYEDSGKGVNLADIWVENPRAVWDLEESENLCEEISQQWINSELPMVECEPRLVLEGLLISNEKDGTERLIPGVWHGIDEGYVDRVWMPNDSCCNGRLAESHDEIVLDAHVVEGLGVELGDVVTIGAGQGNLEFHNSRIWVSPNASLFRSTRVNSSSRIWYFCNWIPNFIWIGNIGKPIRGKCKFPVDRCFGDS